MPPTPIKVLEIRKYPNRRYYDSTRSCMVTVEEMCQLIRAGYDLRVTDSKTGEDITPKVLAQIILDLDSAKLDVFPVALLHRLIRSNEEITKQFVDKYFHSAFEAFLHSQKNFEAQMRRFMGLGQSAEAGGWFGSGNSPFFPGWPAHEPADQSPEQETQPTEPADAVADQLEELKREIAHLKQRVPPAKKKRATARARRTKGT